ncbi:MAG: MBL fold metallo-hydrolase [Pseudomonadota bacterium]
MTCRLFLATVLLLLPAPALASICHAFVRDVPGVQFAQLGPQITTDGPTLASAASRAQSVSIEYVTHSSYRIITEAGIVVVTDYFGANGSGGIVPTVVTMNNAHETHFTDFPDPAIEHVLRGWNPLGDGPAKHMLELEDIVIRNVTTDIRGWGEARVDGNSIFVFEVAGICIGHLGHLHHLLDDSHYTMLGKLDVVMAPVDGTYTVDTDDMITMMKRLKSRIVLPMHAFGPGSMRIFLDGMSDAFRIVETGEKVIEVSLLNLPQEPTVMLLSNHITTGSFD